MNMNKKLSVVLATRNEEKNIRSCIQSIKSIADEIIVVDENSTDNTREIAKEMGAKVYLEPHHSIFHITKQKALDLATSEWILQLDADEIVTPELSREIEQVLASDNDGLFEKRKSIIRENRQFLKHQQQIENRDGMIGKKTGEIVAFFIPRLNMFLGKPLRHAGVYPDPAIRLVKKSKASFPAKSVHEIMKVDGEISWLKNDMEHYDSPTFSRYVARANRYTSLTAHEFEKNNLKKNLLTLFYFSTIKPLFVFINLFFRHKGYLDGIFGFVWSIFSAIHFPLAYYKYWTQSK